MKKRVTLVFANQCQNLISHACKFVLLMVHPEKIVCSLVQIQSLIVHMTQSSTKKQLDVLMQQCHVII
jgi:hypothetical protein